MDDNANTPERPSWGKTVGVFFLCTALALAGAAWTSGMVVSGYGYSGYSTGGLLTYVTGGICAAVYRSTGKIAGVAVASLLVGIALGYFAVQMALA